MPDRLRIALAQFNPAMAAPASNAARLRALRDAAAAAWADLLLAPEHALSGAVPPALAADPSFEAACEVALGELAAAPGPALAVGVPWRDGPRLHDAVALLDAGALRARCAAHHPRPGFDPGPVPGPLAFRGARLGLMAGRDWRDPAVAETLAETGADLLVALDSLPHETGGEERVLQAALARVVENGLPIVLLNRLGAEAEDAHDGAALVLNADRTPALRLPPFGEGLTLTEWGREGGSWRCAPRPLPPAMPPAERLWRALLLALRDHAARHGADRALAPITGSPDTALTAALAADAFREVYARAFLLEEGTAPLAARLGLAATQLDLDPTLRDLADILPPLAPFIPPRLRRLVIDSLADSWGAVPVVAGPSDNALAFFPLRHVGAADRRALAAWRNAHRPAGLHGPEAPDLPLPGSDPLPEPGPAPHLTPWQSLSHADYKRRQLPPGLTIAPRAFGPAPRHPQRDEAPAPRGTT